MKLLLLEQLAAQLNVSPDSTRELINGTELQSFSVNALVYYLVDDEWVQKNRHGLL